MRMLTRSPSPTARRAASGAVSAESRPGAAGHLPQSAPMLTFERLVMQTYLSQRGLDAWTSHLMDFMHVTTPAQARAITKEALRQSWNTTVAESTLIGVLERLARER